ncbi:centromere protein U [Mantella aurantiaca]
MAAKKDKSRNKSLAKRSLFKENAADRGPTRKAKQSENKKRKLTQSKQTVLDSFTILKQAGDTLQDDISEESFNPPLHSTAVFTEDEDLLEKTKASLEKSANQTGPNVSQEKSKRPNSRTPKNKTAVSESLTARSVQREQRKTPQNTATSVQKASRKAGASEIEGEKARSTQQTSPVQQATDKTPQNTATSVQKASRKAGASEIEGEKARSTQQTSPVQQATDKSYGKRKSEVKRKKTPNKKKPNKPVQKEHLQMTVWSPEDAPGTAKDVNELDVILFESEKLVERYSESIDGVCRKAVDTFFLSFKEQLTTSIKNVRLLKNLKRKNAKVRLEIGRKQKRLIEVKDEIIKKQPRLNQLERECSELEERQKSIRDAETFLDNLGKLQEDYRKCRTQNPRIKETYGLSSLPALILQAQSTMRAEQHFHNVNTLLQNVQTPGQ